MFRFLLGRGCWAVRAAFLAFCMTGAMTLTASLALAAPAPTPNLIRWKVFPVLVRGGGNVTVSWEATNVASCTVTGSNGDAWTSLSGVQISSPIPAQTIYALHCPPLFGSPDPAIDKSRTVNIVPVFGEK